MAEKKMVHKMIGIPGRPLVHLVILPAERSSPERAIQILSEGLKRIYEQFEQSLDEIPAELDKQTTFTLLLAADFGPEELEEEPQDEPG